MMSPGGPLVLEGAVLEAAVQDAHEAVGHASQGVVVADVTGSEAVVVGAGTE